MIQLGSGVMVLLAILVGGPVLGQEVRRAGPVMKIQQYAPVRPWTDQAIQNDPMSF